jgi:hypothetical protein
VAPSARFRALLSHARPANLSCETAWPARYKKIKKVYLVQSWSFAETAFLLVYICKCYLVASLFNQKNSSTIIDFGLIHQIWNSWGPGGKNKK